MSSRAFRLGRTAAIALLAARAPAAADALADCYQTRDPALEIRACTGLIEAGGLDAATLAKVHTGRGVARVRTGDIDGGIADHDRAIALAPEFALAYANRGSAFSRKGEFARAVADFDRALELKPKLASALNNRAWARLKLGALEPAMADVDSALALRPADPGILDTRGHILEAMGRREEAIAAYRQALAAAPDLAESREGLKRLGAAP